MAEASGRKARPLHKFPPAPLPSTLQIAWESRSSLLIAACPRLQRLSVSGRLKLLASVTCDGFSIDARRRRLANGRDPCPNPSCAGSVHVLDLRSGKVTSVGSPADVNYHAALSPNGRSVSYVREVVNEEVPSGIWLAPTSGRGTPYPIVSAAHLSPAADPVWSPDGLRIAYLTSYPQFYLTVRRLNGGTRRFGPGGIITGAVFSPDSRLLAYDQEMRYRHVALRVVNVRTGRVALNSPPWVRVVRGQAWSPDGTKLLITTSCGLAEATIRSRHWRTFRACH